MPAIVIVTMGLLQVTAQAVAPSADSANRAAYEAYLSFGDLVRGGRVQPGWLTDGHSFWYAEGGPQDRVIYRVTLPANKKEPLFDVARLRAALTEKLGTEPAGRGVPFDQLAFVGPSMVSFVLEGSTWTLDLNTYVLTRQIPPVALDFSPLLVSEPTRGVPKMFTRESFTGLGLVLAPERISPDGKWFVSMANDDIVLRATVDGRTMNLTRDGEPEQYWDVETVKWNPWSPDGQRLAAFRIDTRGMARIPTIQWLKPLETSDEVITVPAGGRLPRNELYVLDVFGGAPVHVDLGDTSDQYLIVLGWLPDGSQLLFARYDRLLTKVDVMSADTRTGTARVIMSEQSKTFLTNQHEAIWGTDTGFTLLPDGSGFLWRSERDGWDHLYHYDLNGKLVSRVTQGTFPVTSVVRVDQKNGWVYFYAHGDQARPYDSHLYRVSMTGTGFRQLTEGPGQHTVQLSPSAEYFTDTFSSVDVPPRTVLRKADGTLVSTLGEADLSPLKKVGWVPPREYVVKAADGKTDLWATMYFPYNFDPNRKYPVVEYIYGGPQTAMRPMDFAANAGPIGRFLNYNRALANFGFLVVTLDARGTPGRSKAFHDVIYRNWGNFEIADHAGAIRQLGAKLPFMDTTRVGIQGASWGGHYAFRALTQAPELYKVAVAEFPGFDPRSLTLYEVYLGMPQDNKALYDAADAFALAPRVKGKLLMNSGTNDTGTIKDLFKMSEQLVRLGIQHDVMVYPNTGHGAFGKSGEYNAELKLRYFIEHLQP
jgi:dipeptidyl aminopeptidase/acylaminoacyl peptidase